MIECELYLHAAAVRMTNRAQWFLINFPMMPKLVLKRKDTSSKPSPRSYKKGKRHEEKVRFATTSSPNDVDREVDEESFWQGSGVLLYKRSPGGPAVPGQRRKRLRPRSNSHRKSGAMCALDGDAEA